MILNDAPRWIERLRRNNLENLGCRTAVDRLAPVFSTKMITRIVSGAQTGADRAGLDVAIRHGFPHGGWCPKGRKAEDGPIGGQYNLVETPSANYLQRTEWNVRDSDGTVVFTLARNVTGGSLRTIEFARKHGKPWIHISKAGDYNPAVTLQGFVKDNGIGVLNVAGSRGSKEPDLWQWVCRIVEDAFFWSSSHPNKLGGPEEG